MSELKELQHLWLSGWHATTFVFGRSTELATGNASDYREHLSVVWEWEEEEHQELIDRERDNSGFSFSGVCCFTYRRKERKKQVRKGFRFSSLRQPSKKLFCLFGFLISTAVDRGACWVRGSALLRLPGYRGGRSWPTRGSSSLLLSLAFPLSHLGGANITNFGLSLKKREKIQ
jgi:hypothetical protein